MMNDSRQNSRLKILFLPAWYPTESNPISGIFIREHAKAVSLYNEVLIIYTYYVENLRTKSFYEIKETINDSIKIFRVRYRTFFSKSTTSLAQRLLRLWLTFICFRRVLKKGWKPDIIHAHVYAAGLSAIILGRMYKIPVVMTEHWTSFLLHKLTLTRYIVAKFVMNRAKIVLPVSNALKRALETYGIKAKFSVVPNVVDTSKYFPISHIYKTNMTSRIRRILCVAMLCQRKGIDSFLETIALLKIKRRDFSLDLIGDGPDRRRYEEQATRLQINELVKFHGFVSEERKIDFMKRCDFFVLPSIAENFGVVFIEAIACGKPVIASDIPGPNEFIKEFCGILTPPSNVEKLAEAVDHMLDHYKDYDAGRLAKYAKERFGYEIVGKQIDGIYRQIVKT